MLYLLCSLLNHTSVSRMLGNVIIKNRRGASLALTDKTSTPGPQSLADLWVVENAITA